MAEQVFELVEAEILLPFLRVLVLAVLLLDVEEVEVESLDSLFHFTVDFELHAVGIALHEAVNGEVFVRIIDACDVGKVLSLFFDIVEHFFCFLLGLCDGEEPFEVVVGLCKLSHGIILS